MGFKLSAAAVPDLGRGPFEVSREPASTIAAVGPNLARRMVRGVLLSLTLAASLLAFAGPAFAQSETENRLREALRRATADLRGVQDGQARLQAEATQNKAERDQFEARSRELEARVAELEAAPKGPTPEQLAEVAALRAAGQALLAENQDLRAAIARWQGAYNEAATVARQKEAERLGYASSLRAARAAVDAAAERNVKLTAVANDILKLYENEDFRNLLRRSYEPVLGFWRVRLENTVQEQEDRIRAERFSRESYPIPAEPQATAMPASIGAEPARGRPARRQP